MKFREWITDYLEAKSDKEPRSLLSFLRKRFAKRDAQPVKRSNAKQPQQELPQDDGYPAWDYDYYGGEMDDNFDWRGEAITPGGKMFREWLKNRVTNEALNTGAGNAAPMQPNGTPMDPKMKMKNQAVSNVAGNLIKKNPKGMVPGATKPQDVANAMNDPAVSTQPDDVKQGVAQFLQGDQKK